MNTVENNKLIAEFMGAGYEENKYSHESSDYYFESCELEYHFNWNWLMPVVKKIRGIINVDLTINEFECVKEMELNLEPYDYEINQVHMAVVEFIKWYNENNKDENK